MQRCKRGCIPACMTCQEFDDRGRTDGKGLCTLMSLDEPIEVDGMHKCKKFKCIDVKDD